jgi:SAM-dependent methyltransferase
MTGETPSTRPSARVVDERLELPFDQYQRYEVTSALLAGFKVASGSLVLEVGGGPGPLESFLPDYELFVSDVSGAPHERFLLADGSKLPFADDTFAVVVTLDVLEHVPPGIRAPFLSELLRVSRDLVVLSAPFAHPDLELAEEALNEFIRARFQGDFPTLDEHADNGLPELNATVEALGATGATLATLPSGYLPHWLVGMLVHHELLATGLPHLGKLHAYYNQVVSPYDCREPSYRHVIVAAHDRDPAEVERVVGSLRAQDTPGAGQAALNAIAGAILAQRLNAVARTEVLGRELDEMRGLAEVRMREVADRDAHIFELERRLQDLHAEKEDLKDEAQRRWLLGIPYAAGRVRRKLSHRKESNPG